MNSQQLTQSLKAEARRLGFSLAGACPAVEPPGLGRLQAWLSAGYAGRMSYIEQRAEAYAHPRHVLDGVRSLLVLAMSYRTDEPNPAGPLQGRVARYAWGSDYHDLIRDRLNRLAEFLQQLAPGSRSRGVVDTAPLLEREFAQLAGLGWIGKNTLLLNRELGSWFFLAVLLTDVVLDYDQPHAADHCGACRACLDACPTDAFAAPYVLDSRRCISYLTIELREAIPQEFRTELGGWLFGCDVCQEVCPWNHKAPPTEAAGLAPAAGINPVELMQLFELDDDAFRLRFRHSPLWRSKRRGVLRNAAILLGAARQPAALPALSKGLADSESLVRGASAWALGQIASDEALGELRLRLPTERDPEVRREMESALAQRDVSSADRLGSGWT